MEVQLLERRDDGYEAYVIVLEPQEVQGLLELKHAQGLANMEETIEGALIVGAEGNLG